MIVLSAGCASLASLMQRDADADGRRGPDTERAPPGSERRLRLISTTGADQRAVRVSPACQTR